MKRKLPRWAVYLIGTVVSFVLTALLLPLEDTALGGLATNLGILCIFAHLAFLVALIVHLLRRIVARATRDHAAVEAELRQQDASDARRARATGSDGASLPPPSPAESPWWAVIVLLVTVFPVGIYLVILKTAYEKARYFSNGVRLIVLGAVLMVPSLGFILTLLLTGADSTSILLQLCGLAGIPGLAGLFCFVFGWVLRHLGGENDAYRRLILVEKVTDMPTITRRMGTDYAHATRVIERLMDAGLLPDAYLYHRDHELIVPGVSKKIALRCKNCSGTTVLYSNEPHICDYCGGDL